MKLKKKLKTWFWKLGYHWSKLDITNCFRVIFFQIVLFYSVESKYQYIEVKAKDKNIEVHLHIFRNNNQYYESLSFEKEQRNRYEIIIDFSDNKVTYNNLGILHLAIPHVGQASLFLRSSKYSSSLIVTHITELHSILNSKMDITSHNSFMLISDGRPDFNPVSVLNQIYSNIPLPSFLNS